MSGDLTPELQSLLAAEREADGPDGGARDRVAGRLAKTLGVTLAAAGASTAATSGAQTALPKAVVGKSLAAKLLVAAVVGGVGAGGVAVTVKLLHQRSARAHHVSALAPAPAPTPMPPASLPSLPVADAPASLAAPSPSAVAPSPPMAAPTATVPAHLEHHVARRHDLAAERALLADARAAMQSADAARALAILDEHARRFPRGQLAEERDALRVAALWRAGDHDAARRHADEFARRHPDSLFLPSVQRAVTESPGAAQ